MKKPLTAFDHLESVRLSIGDASRAWAVERDELLDQIARLSLRDGNDAPPPCTCDCCELNLENLFILN